MLVGGNCGCPGAHERVEDDAGHTVSAAQTGWLPLANREQAAVSAHEGAVPRLAAVRADPFRASGQQGTLCETYWEDGEVSAPESGCRQRPDVAGILAERM